MAEKSSRIRGLGLAYKVAWDAYCHFNEDDGWALASHVALSGLLALFPFLIFGTALAGFLGADSFSETAVHLLFDTWPEDIAAPLSREVEQVLTIPRGGLLTLSVLAAAYFASNGVEALRVSLNRAYRVSETRAWYMTRLASLGFVIAVVVIFAFISTLLVAVPVGLRYAERFFPWLEWLLRAASDWGIYGTVLVLMTGLILSHKWLPDGERRIVDVLPGVVVTLVFWTIGALIFASYLSTFANYAATYAGLASVMIVLVFLYMVGVIFMLGAEINAALMKYRVYSVVVHARRKRHGHAASTIKDASEPDATADVRR
ncbi:membrane protein [Pseudorhizobium tarimense]|uniref:Membrane protein n=1 Tax=Pseudorhizobium tarimense TaxID=1079109 RepID=A0ABV2HA54_9HYPH|nr:YihY/virulence factor BrkB family protein [Pseudorhizobium tarimense]MCJ8520288.1 YihY/virulence factor BrkB family protein [Pseudorhizobium tarimense]